MTGSVKKGYEPALDLRQVSYGDTAFLECPHTKVSLWADTRTEQELSTGFFCWFDLEPEDNDESDYESHCAKHP